MKLNLLLTLLLHFSIIGQKIENIDHEQFGREIIISYDLNETIPSNFYKIKAECLIDGKIIPIVSANGNGFGNVKGGSSRKIAWDVLKDTPSLVGNQVSFKLVGIGIGTDLVATESMPKSVADQKAILLNELSRKTDTYLEQLYNLVTIFNSFGKTAFESRSDFNRIDTQVDKTNKAYEDLLPSKETYKQTTRSLWGSEAINCQFEGFLDKILDGIHRSYILPLNNTIKTINEIQNDASLRRPERTQKTERIKIEVEIRCSQLIEEVNTAKGDAKRLYELLRQ
jgi:hypothetical protein